MAMQITIAFGTPCATGFHIPLQVTVLNTVTSQQRQFRYETDMQALFQPSGNVSIEDILAILIRNFRQEGAFANFAAFRTALAAKTFTI